MNPRMDWSEALCRTVDLEMFFPERENLDNTRAAKRVCGWCPLRTACLAEALATGVEFGVWGGLDSRERRALRHAHTGAVLVDGRPVARVKSDYAPPRRAA